MVFKNKTTPANREFWNHVESVASQVRGGSEMAEEIQRYIPVGNAAEGVSYGFADRGGFAHNLSDEPQVVVLYADHLERIATLEAALREAKQEATAAWTKECVDRNIADIVECNEKLKAERAQARAENERLKADASWAATHRSELADLRDAFSKSEAERDDYANLMQALQRKLEAMSKPVSDEEILAALNIADNETLRAAMTVTRWKDGIDVEKPTHDAENFANAILAARAKKAEATE